MHINDILQYRRLATVIRRFEDKYIPEPMSGCWLWEGAMNARGYGVVGILHRTWIASRVSYVLHVGPLPTSKASDRQGHCVLHNCDNPACVNPDHLRIGTMLDNIHDMIERGRAAKNLGALYGIDREAIRIERASGASFAAIGSRYGVSGAAIRRVCL